ncbi:MAG: acyltransferase, partial [Acidocella sp.]|nr:acyltransferase [Acidocella sp.]
LPRFFLEFIIGITTMRLVPLNADVMPNRHLAIFATLAVVFLACFRLDILVITALWLLLAALMMRADAGQPPVVSKPGFLLFLGRISYSFYMSFGTAELLLAQFYRHQGWNAAYGKLIYISAMCLITLALAVALHVLVETPARKWADSKLTPPGLAQAGQPR